MSPKTKPTDDTTVPVPAAPAPQEPAAGKVRKERKKKTEDAAQEPVKKQPVKADPQEGGEDATSGKDGKKRTFTVVKVVRDGKETEFKGGRYSSNSPSSAARKSANLACKEYGDGRQEIDIYMQETTKNSAKKSYAYHAVRTKVDEKDVSFQTGGGDKVSVPFKFQMSVKALREKPAPPAAAVTAE